METRKLNLDEMAQVEGGMSCGWAYGIAAFTAVAMVGATVVKPTIWAVPATWKSAAGLISANAVNIAYCGE